MLSKETLFELWKKNYRRDTFTAWFLTKNGVLKLVKDEDPELHKRIKEARAHRNADRKVPTWRRQPKAANGFKTSFELWNETADAICKDLNLMVKPYLTQLNEDYKAECERKRNADAPNKFIAYAIMRDNKFYRGNNGGDRPNIYWNKEKVVRSAKHASSGRYATSGIKVVELEIKVTDRKLDLNS